MIQYNLLLDGWWQMFILGRGQYGMTCKLMVNSLILLSDKYIMIVKVNTPGSSSTSKVPVVSISERGCDVKTMRERAWAQASAYSSWFPCFSAMTSSGNSVAVANWCSQGNSVQHHAAHCGWTWVRGADGIFAMSEGMMVEAAAGGRHHRPFQRPVLVSITIDSG